MNSGTTQSGGSSGDNCTTGTGTTSSTASSSAGKNVQKNNNNIENSSFPSKDHQDQGELFLLYRLVRQRHIYHGYNAKSLVTNRKKGVLIPQEFPGKSFIPSCM